MKAAQIVVFAFLVLCVSFSASQGTCNHESIKDKLQILSKDCIDAMKKQAVEELKASLKYLSLAAHFSHDKQNRPGFAKLYFDSASEEREHSIKIMNYLLMRGDALEPNDFSNLYPESDFLTDDMSCAKSLEVALDLENSVTNKIYKMVNVCEEPKSASGKNDYALVDYLTGEFLDEQYKSMRDFAGKLTTLNKMQTAYGDLGNYLFDKKLLNEEIPVV